MADPSNSKKTLSLTQQGRDRAARPSVRTGPRARAAARATAAPAPAGPIRTGPRPRTDTPPRPQRGTRTQPDLRTVATAAGEMFAVFAPCPHGLEQALADELTKLGFTQVRPGRSGCHFAADWRGVMRANLHSRLATRILVQVAEGQVTHEDDLLELAQTTPWERWFGARHTLRVDTSAIRSPMRSLQYCTLRTKDGICDRLRTVEGARPNVDTVRPDARVHLFLHETTATLYLDTSGESLFKRGWRFDKGEAPLRENLAAGLLRLAGWDGTTDLIDPFCGSGTIVIEAAYLALGVPPGMARPFAFERLRGHDAGQWAALKDEARAGVKSGLDIALIGSDSSAEAIAAAHRNAQRAGLGEGVIEFEVRDVRDIRPTARSGFIITNPPYGARMSFGEHAKDTGQPCEQPEPLAAPADTETAARLWREWSHTLKAHFDGWRVFVISSDRDLPQHLRLTARRRTPVYNGALQCRFFEFEVRAGSYRQKI